MRFHRKYYGLIAARIGKNPLIKNICHRLPDKCYSLFSSLIPHREFSGTPAHQAGVRVPFRGAGRSSEVVTSMSEVKHFACVVLPWPFEAYAHIISPLSAQEKMGLESH